ncbi:hypothetical protein [Thermospira aquatica]|uniref:Aminotransferase class III-fold pyridoxal phosphate-dependent enzyme n=1 Tax=Thermospira aquatica TaxID=2828656 RepID=A0AAX3BG28_9SPIR|nr:hypothetical protein [Thermospira aquatica]URA11189.1 hypothetical protein KDW03_05185 [Thermospira aquatica]
MSDYPKGSWHPRQSESLMSRLSGFSHVPFIVRRARGVFLYDIDNYKYIDFFLNHGEVLLGYKPQNFQNLKNSLSRMFYGSPLSLVHYRLEQKAKLWLEKQNISWKSLLFFGSVAEALLYLQEILGFSSFQSKVWSIPFPGSSSSKEVIFFERLNEQLEDETIPSSGLAILVENACFGRLSNGLSLKEGWDMALVGGVISNGAGGAMLISQKKLPPVSPPPFPVANAMLATFQILLARDTWEWPKLPPLFHQRGGCFKLPSDIQPETLLPHGVFVQKTAFLSFAHEEPEIRRLIKAVQGQGVPSTNPTSSEKL